MNQTSHGDKSAPAHITVELGSGKTAGRSRCLGLVASAFLLPFLPGCARHYNIVLNNNNVITTYGKPKVTKTGDAYVFKNSRGEWTAVPRGSVKLIEPQSHHSSSPKEQLFKPSPQ